MGEELETRNWRTVLRDIVLFASTVGVVITFLGWMFLSWSEWKDVPDRLSNLETIISAQSGEKPQVVKFIGHGVVNEGQVEQGGSISVVYVLRRTVSCNTTVRVRFYNHETNTIESSASYEIPAVTSPVSTSFSQFAVQVQIPPNLRPGIYSYFPEMIPLDCGVYESIVVPMSDPFEVTGR